MNVTTVVGLAGARPEEPMEAGAAQEISGLYLAALEPSTKGSWWVSFKGKMRSIFDVE